MARKLLFSAVKNEAPFLVEWVAYHRVIGFDKIVIVSYDCTDGTVELLDALHAYGIVEHIPEVASWDRKPKNSAAHVALSRDIITDGDWGIWLDADEFLNIQLGAGHLEDVLRSFGKPLVAASLHKEWLSGKQKAAHAWGGAVKDCAALGQINHHSARKPDMLVLKGMQGHGANMASTLASKHGPDFKCDMHLADPVDHGILRHEGAVADEVERVAQYPKVAKALELVAERLNSARHWAKARADFTTKCGGSGAVCISIATFITSLRQFCLAALPFAGWANSARCRVF